MNRYSLEPGRVILRDGVQFVSLNSYHAHADADDFARRIVEAMAGVEIERAGRVVARSKSLRLLARYRAGAVLDVCIHPRPANAALLVITWSDGAQARVMFPSVEECRLYCYARRTWRFRILPNDSRLSDDDLYKIIRYWRLELRQPFAGHVIDHCNNWQWGEIARKTRDYFPETMKRGEVF